MSLKAIYLGPCVTCTVIRSGACGPISPSHERRSWVARPPLTTA